MAISTYSDLVSTVVGYLHRTDLTSKVSVYVAMAEAEMNRLITARRQIQRDTMTVSAETASLPSDFNGMRAVRFTDGLLSTLTALSPEQIADMKDNNTLTGSPQFYAIVGDDLEFFPVPDGSYTLQMSYYQRIPGLESNGSNWLLTDHPDIYVKGALKYAYIDVRDDDRAGLADGQFRDAIAQLNQNSLSESAAGALQPTGGGFVV